MGPVVMLYDDPVYDDVVRGPSTDSLNIVSAVTTPAVPASTTAVKNSTGLPVTVFVKGGTLTVISVGGVATGIAAAAAANTCHILPLAINQTIAITYSVAPTWVWVGAQD